VTSTLGYFNPAFYAQETLIYLHNKMGLARRIHTGFDAERRTFNRGEYINISGPATFTVEDAPSTAQELQTQSVQIRLDKWKEVKFKVTDKEMAFTGEQIIEKHIAPAATKIANYIDLDIAAQYKNIPWFYDLNSTPGSVITDVTGPYRVLFENGVPMDDPSMLHYMIDGGLQAGLQGLSQFAQHQGSAEAGVRTQLTGSLGTRYGMEFFANQNVPTHTKGTANTGTVAVKGETAAGATTITLDAGTLTGTVVPGDSFVIAGNTQRYAITNTVTAGSNEMVGITFTPALVATAANDAVATIRLETGKQNLVFHRNAFALAFGKLPQELIRTSQGAMVSSVQDPVTGIAVRARIYYVGNSSETHVALDVLYGTKTLDPNLAARAND
jgi:hypothetical protein